MCIFAPISEYYSRFVKTEQQFKNVMVDKDII